MRSTLRPRIAALQTRFAEGTAHVGPREVADSQYEIAWGDPKPGDVLDSPLDAVCASEVADGPCRAGKLSALAFATHQAHLYAMAATTSSTATRENTRRLVYVRAADLDRWQCRPVGTIEILDLHDRPVGHLDGIVIDKRENQPTYLVIATQRSASTHRPQWFLVPVGDAWFDDGTRAVRMDATKREQVPFDPEEFERMAPEQADEFERRLLANCCPEVGFHHDGTPDYARLQQFTCPTWLRE